MSRDLAPPVARMRSSFEQARADAARAGKNIDAKLVRIVKAHLHLSLPDGASAPAPPPNVNVPGEGVPRRLPGHPIAENVVIGYRVAGDSIEREEEVDVLGFDARRNTDGTFTLTAIIAYSHDEERQRRFAIRHIVAFQAQGEPTVLTHRAPIMVCLRALAGFAITDDEKLAATLEAGADAALEYADEDEILAKDLRLDVWIEYTDQAQERSRRRITITSIHGYEDPEYGWETQRVEAFCHQRQAMRTFMVRGISAVAERDEALRPMPTDLVEYWLRRAAGKTRPEDKDLEWELANPEAAAARRAEEEARWQAEQERAAQEAEARVRRRALAAGVEHAVEPQRVKLTTRRGDDDRRTVTADLYVIGYDTSAEGAVTVLFVATRLDVKRGRAIYIGETREPENTKLVELRFPPDGDPVPDVAAWVSGLPSDPSRELAPHG